MVHVSGIADAVAMLPPHPAKLEIKAMKKDDQATSKIPEGWALVPIEPNWDMRNEGREFLIDGLEKDYEKVAYFLWKTMVNASPKAPHG